MENLLGRYLVQTQKTTLAPKMVKFLKVLQIPGVDLVNYIEEELKENPILELDFEDVNKWNSLKDSEYTPADNKSSISRDAVPPADNFLSHTSSASTLKDYLKIQLSELKIDAFHRKIAEFIIENIDSQGYLRESIKRLSAAIKVDERELKKCLKVIQSMEPAGVGARSLKECLLIQLKIKKVLNNDIKVVILEHFDLLARNNFLEISKKTGLNVNEIGKIFKLIKQLNPKPGASFRKDEPVQYIVPDLIVVEIDGNYYVQYNNESIPSVRINNYYKNLLKASDSSSEVKEYVKRGYLKAVTLIKAIEKRKNTVLRIAEHIINYQKDFLKKGVEHLTPLTMKAIADSLEISESTVSRAVSGKYIQTPAGTYELKFFFSTDLKGTSSVSIKDTIRKIVLEENKIKPLSDKQIGDILESRGIKVARRTIAKYRQELSILPSSMRKEIPM